MERQQNKEPINTKHVKSLRILSESDSVKPQWFDKRTRVWKDFRGSNKVVRERIYPSKFHGYELVHLTNCRVERAVRRTKKWLEEWKKENHVRVDIVDIKPEIKKTSKPVDEEKVEHLCEQCGRKILIRSLPKQSLCSGCRELDLLKSLHQTEEPETSA